MNIKNGLLVSLTFKGPKIMDPFGVGEVPQLEDSAESDTTRQSRIRLGTRRDESETRFEGSTQKRPNRS